MSVALAPVFHRTIEIDGIEIFCREAGPPDGPVVLPPHGHPSSSFQFRTFTAVLGDRWPLIAPDYPGFGSSAQPDPSVFTYSSRATPTFSTSCSTSSRRSLRGVPGRADPRLPRRVHR